MANNQINKLLEFANMQMAAEAFLSLASVRRSHSAERHAGSKTFSVSDYSPRKIDSKIINKIKYLQILPRRLAVHSALTSFAIFSSR